MWFMLSEDLGNVNPKHEFICIYMWNVIACVLVTLRWDDVDLMMPLRWMSLYVYTWNVIACDVDDIEMR